MRYILFAFAILWAGMAQASQITITSINSWWTVKTIVDLTGGNGNLTGDGTNEIRWGTPFPGFTGEKSGFRFQQAAQGTTQNSDTLFKVGDFTHMNRVIYQNQYLDSAQLNMVVTAKFDDGVERNFETSYMFSLWETPNYANPCANGEQNRLNSLGKKRRDGRGSDLNRNGCADRVELLENDSLQKKFTQNGLTYEFQLFGFDSGPQFWTVENLENVTSLNALFRVSGVPTVVPPPIVPPPSVVPLPAGVWLLLGGLGGLALLRRRAARG